MAVAVEGQGNALASDGLPQQKKVPLSILLLPEESRRDRSRGIIYGSHQGEIRPSTLKPVMLAAIYLQQHPFLRIARSPGTVLGRSPAAWTAHPVGQQDAPRLAGER